MIDWRRIVLDLEQRGYSHAGIANVICVSRTAILSWKNSGVVPLYDKGERMINLWCAVTANTRKEVPARNVPEDD